MPQCQILETFKGSQDGRYTQTFEAGTTVEVSEYLISCAPKGALRCVSEDQISLAEDLANDAVERSRIKAKKREEDGNSPYLTGTGVENKATITTTTRHNKRGA